MQKKEIASIHTVMQDSFNGKTCQNMAIQIKCIHPRSDTSSLTCSNTSSSISTQGSADRQGKLISTNQIRPFPPYPNALLNLTLSFFSLCSSLDNIFYLLSSTGREKEDAMLPIYMSTRSVVGLYWEMRNTVNNVQPLIYRRRKEEIEELIYSMF